MSDSQGGNFSGIAMAAYMLQVALFGKLRAKGLLTHQELIDLVDDALLSLEELGLQGSEAKTVHAIVEQTRVLLETSAKRPKSI